MPWSAASRVVVATLLQFPQDPEWICEPLFGAPTGTSISILPTGWTESLAIFTAEGLEWHPQEDLLPQHGNQVDLVSSIGVALTLHQDCHVF